MSSIQFLGDDLLLEVGRVAVLRGTLRLSLLSAGDAVLSTRLGDQGIIRLAMQGRDLPEICQVLQTLAKVRGVEPKAVESIAAVSDEHAADFALAAAVADGTWTYLGGDPIRHYGLFLGEAAQDGDLMPQWREINIVDLRALSERLEKAYQTLRPFSWAMRAASGVRSQEPPK